MSKKFVTIIIILFVIVSAILFAIKYFVPAFSFGVLMGGNIVLAIVSITTYLVIKRKIAARPQAFVQSVMASSFIKLIVCMTALLVYVLVDRANIHKPSIFVLMGVYAVYTSVETWLLSMMAREAN
jgi:hypothetical protein